MQKISPRYYPFLLIGLGCFFFFPFLGRVHLFDWDEINFAESAREMLVTDNYTRVQINFQPFWEKPPLFFWLQAIAMTLFGVGEYAARFPNAVIGVFTLLTLFFIGRNLYDSRFGLLWAIGYLGSITPHFYFKTAIIDPTFNYFIFLGVWFLFKRKTLLSGLFIGLAVLTKGPVGALLPGVTFLAFWALQGFRPVIRFRDGVLLVMVALLVASFWFGLEVAQHGWWFMQEFMAYQIKLFSTPDAGHAQPFYYHFVVVLLGCFPLSVLAIRYLLPHTSDYKSAFALFRRSTSEEPGPSTQATAEEFRLWMVLLFWVVMIIFTIVRTKIVHYSSMSWFPVSYLGTYHLYHYINSRLVWNRWTTVGLLIIGGLLGIALTLLPIVGMNAGYLIPYIKDPFAVANLQADVYWAGWEWLIGGSWLIVMIWCILRLKTVGYPAAVGLFLSTALCLWFYLANVVPTIEEIVQGSVIRFYESKQGQDVYVEPIGYKSYAHLFYFRKHPPINYKTTEEDYLLNGPVDKPTFLITRLDRAQHYRNHPNLTIIKEENGFVFFQRRR